MTHLRFRIRMRALLGAQLLVALVCAVGVPVLDKFQTRDAPSKTAVVPRKITVVFGEGSVHFIHDYIDNDNSRHRTTGVWDKLLLSDDGSFSVDSSKY